MNTPLTVVGFFSMYAFGAGILTLLKTSGHFFGGDFIDAFLEYYFYSALPPTSLEHVFLVVIVGTLTAGTKWFIKTAM